MSSYGYILGKGQARLRRVSSAWTDTEMVTIRTMAADGATAQEIGVALGWTPSRVDKFIKRNHLTWNRKTEDRHAVLVAANRSNQGLPIDTSWRALAEQMHDTGRPMSEIVKACGRSNRTIAAWLEKRAKLSTQGERA